MDINQLNCFISVAQTLNFSEAARRNYVSQSTVSRYIGELEKEFGAKGSASRKAAEDKAWEEYNAQILLDVRNR